MIRTFDKSLNSKPHFGPLSLRMTSVLAALLLGSMFTYLVLKPTVGIDDANITQVYGQAFAERLEFTYFAAGERVEGSTSLLWTLINALAYVLPGEGEFWITATCIALTALTLLNCWTLGRITFTDDSATWLTTYSALFCGLFLAIPSFFAWSVWSLMDITIWLALLSAGLVFTAEQLRADSAAMTLGRSTLFASCFALLTVTRPEGIAIAIGMLSYLLLHAVLRKQTQTRNQYIWALVAILVVFGTATIWRMSYFGVPLPNTYYAKVTNGTLDQIISGSLYLLEFIRGDLNALLLVLAGVGVAVSLNFRNTFWTIMFDPRGLLCLFLLGLFSLYVFIGGDHFGSYRFYQPAFLVIIPLIAGSAVSIFSELESSRARTLIKMSYVALIMSVSVSLIGFSGDGGRLDHEFRIAESGRNLGTRLNQLSEDTSIA
ncbi:MAG: hypothetical protein AAGL99_11875, partial [Pseudomonadota bacterium]